MLIERVRQVEKKTGEPILIIQDLQGPKIRVGALPKEGVVLTDHAVVCFDTSQKAYAPGVIPVDYEALHQHVRVGERLLLDDGKIETAIKEVRGSAIIVTVVHGGFLTSHKGINVPDSTLEVSALTDKDKNDVAFGVQHGIDTIALSFVMSAKDVFDLKYVIEQYEKDFGVSREMPVRIIAKIERHEAVKHIEEILDAADGIMIARGDLGIEVPAEDVPLIQKQLIDKALDAAKPVIVATQMLDSMQSHPRPTRAEVSDVANAVIDHTDAVMLSNETATGQFPVEAVQTMADIILKTEQSVYDNMPSRSFGAKKRSIDDVISELSKILAEDVSAKLILAASITGDTGRLISRHRPELPIVVATSSERVRHQLNVSWGIKPFLLVPCNSIEELIERSISALKKQKAIKAHDNIIVAAGEPVGHAGHVNLLEVKQIV